MAIKIGLSLEGTDKVESQIDSVQKKGEELSKSFNEIGKSGGGLNVDKIANDLKNAGLNFEQTGEKAIKLSGSFNVLRASLRLLGVEGTGALGSLSRLFSGGGLLTLAGVATGVAAVKIGQLEESFAQLQGQLSDTFGSSQKGQQAFAALQNSAKEFGTSVSDLGPVLNSFQTALSNVDRSAKGFVALKESDLPFPDPRNVQAASTAVDNFIKILRAGRQTQDEAQKTAKAFFDTFRDGGPITSAAVRQLPIGTINLLKDALGAAGLKSQEFFAALDAGTVPFDKLAAALQNFSPQAQRAFDTKAIKTMGDALEQLLQTLNKGFSSLTGKTFSDAIIASLGLISSAIQKIIDGIDTITEKDANLKGAALLRATGGVTTGPTIEQAFGPDFQGPLQQQGTDAAKAFGKGFVDASRDLQSAGDKAGELFGKGFISNPFFQNLPQEIEQAIPEEKRQILLKPVLSEEELQANALAAGQRYFQKLQEGIDSQPPPQFPGLLQGLDNAGQAVLDKAQQLWNGVKQIIEQQINFNIGGQVTGGGGGSTFPPIFAGGGAVRGPGSTTSDSIMAFLSNREWVINAKAVDFYGSSLFAALNSMKLPRSLLTGMPKFAEGGQASTGGASTLTLVLGGRSFSTSTSDETLTSLRRFAVHSQLASIGRKPGFVR